VFNERKHGKDVLMPTPIDLRLARHGVIVLLLGLLTGFGIPHLHSRQLGNAAHLVGLIGGFGIVTFGLLWPRLNLGRFWSTAGVWMTALSMYLSWLGLVLLGVFESGPWGRAGQVAVALGGWLALFAAVVVLVGLRKFSAPATESAMLAPVGGK
jgi:(hydroxyamino)benzene mutase